MSAKGHERSQIAPSATRVLGVRFDRKLPKRTVKSREINGNEGQLTMDPITTAILAVLPALASDMVKSGVKNAYEELKAVIRRKWGDAGPISKAIAAIEEDPNSRAQAAVLEEKVAAVKAAQDVEVVQALHHLVEQMKSQGIGGGTVATIQFSVSGGVVQGVAGAENVRIGSMTFGRPPKP
jgi:hypothetical protein